MSDQNIKKIDIQQLAKLARIKVDNNEETSLTKDMSHILQFIEQIKGAMIEPIDSVNFFRLTKNRYRSDEEVEEVGIYQSEIMRVAPNSQDGYFKVKKIIDKN